MAFEILESQIYIDGQNDNTSKEIERIRNIPNISSELITRLTSLENKLDTMKKRNDTSVGDNGWNAQVDDGQVMEIVRQDNIGRTTFLEYATGTPPPYFTYPKTEEDAYKLLMNKSYYAQTNIIYMVQRLFEIKPIVIGKRDKEVDDINFTKLSNNGEYSDSKITALRTYFKIEDSISLEEGLDNTVDKVIFVLQENAHYNLFVFGTPASEGKNIPQTKSRKTRKREPIHDIPTRKSTRIDNKSVKGGTRTRRIRDIIGGASSNKEALFYMNKWNNTLPNKEGKGNTDILNFIN